MGVLKKFGLTSLALGLALSTVAAARDIAPAPVSYDDGAIGEAQTECGLGDLCATLRFKNGDRIDIYNGGAPHCQPYTLNVVRMHGDVKIFDYQKVANKTADSEGLFGDKRCGGFENTFLTLDNGRARLGIFQSGDGALFATWSNGSTGFSNADFPIDNRPLNLNATPATPDPAATHPPTCTVKTGDGTYQNIDWKEPSCARDRADWPLTHTTPPEGAF